MELISIIISVLALLFSGYTYFAHDRKLKKQEEILKDYQLRSLAQNEAESKKAVIRAKTLKMSGGKRTLYIYNVGKAKARNVTIELPNPDEVYACSPDFPIKYNELLPDAPREIILFLSEGDDELTLNYTWDDDFATGNVETQTVDL